MEQGAHISPWFHKGGLLYLPWVVCCINGAAARQGRCECDLLCCIAKSLWMLCSEPGRSQQAGVGTGSSCSDMQLLPGADLQAGLSICFSLWLTTVLWEMMLLPLSPGCDMSLLHSNLRSSFYVLCKQCIYFVCFTVVPYLFRLPSSPPLPPPPMHVPRSGFQMSSSELCKT